MRLHPVLLVSRYLSNSYKQAAQKVLAADHPKTPPPRLVQPSGCWPAGTSRIGGVRDDGRHTARTPFSEADFSFPGSPSFRIGT